MNKLNTKALLKKFKTSKNIMLRKASVLSVNFFQKEVFDSEGAALGKKWVKGKKKTGKTLLETAIGQNSIEYNIEGDTFTIEAKAPYMKYHQLGSGNLPVRKYMGQSDVLDEKIKTMITRELSKL